MTSILFIGIGTMGSAMVRNLTAGGFSVTVSDLDFAAARALCADTGATLVKEPYQAIGIDTVILMVPDSRAVSAVLGTPENPRSLIRVLPQGAIVIDMSSSGPEAARQHCSTLRGLGLEFIDAPVSGGRARAIDGELALMVRSENEAVFERVLPVLQAMGSTIARVGEVGSAHAMKKLAGSEGIDIPVSEAAMRVAQEALDSLSENLLGRRFGKRLCRDRKACV